MTNQELTDEKRLFIIKDIPTAVNLLLNVFKRRQEERLKRLEDRFLEESVKPIWYDTLYDFPQDYIISADAYDSGFGGYE